MTPQTPCRHPQLSNMGGYARECRVCGMQATAQHFGMLARLWQQPAASATVSTAQPGLDDIARRRARLAAVATPAAPSPPLTDEERLKRTFGVTPCPIGIGPQGRPVWKPGKRSQA